MSENNVADASYIRAELARRGYSQSYAAERLGIAPQAFSQRMHGRTEWTLGDMTQLAELLDCSLDRLAGREDR